MDENVLFAGLVALPIVLMFALVFFFRGLKGKPQRWTWLVVGNTLVFLQLCSVVLLVGEVYYRFYYDTTDSFGLSKTTVRWFERHFHRNQNGFRDSVNYGLGIQSGQRRVTFLGDSFTAGHGVADVEDRFANRVRSARICGEVHAISRCGIDTGGEIAMLVDLNDFSYEFDTVVLVYCLNDISDIVPEWQENLDRIYEAPSPGFLLEESYFLNHLYCRWRSAREPSIADYYGFITDAYRSPVWEQQQQRLQMLRDEVHRRGGRLVVVTFPFLHALGVDYEYRFVHELLNQHWRDLGIPHLDLLSIYESLEPDQLVVSGSDPHPNELAHAMAATSIAEFLTAQMQENVADLD